MNVCPDNISDRSNLVWWCIISSQSIIQKYHFAIFKVKATIVSIRSSETLKLLQSKLVWWYIITRQGKLPWKDFLAFTQDMRQCGLGDCGLDYCHSWLSQYLKQGQYQFQSRKCGKNIAFVMNILWSMVQVCYSYILLYLWWCPHNMWDRLLIKCDWLLTLESKKQISSDMYIYIYGSDQVSAMHPTSSSKSLWEKKKKN